MSYGKINVSIRLRFTLLYNAILALTLFIFGGALYPIQSQSTLQALRTEMARNSSILVEAVLRQGILPSRPAPQPPPGYQPLPFDQFSSDPAFRRLQEREIVRLLDYQGNLIVSPFGAAEDALPLSAAALKALQAGQEQWETETVNERRLLIYNRPLIHDGQVAYILQLARPLSERDNSLGMLSSTLIGASLVTLLAAFGIGWALSGIMLQPIQRMTQTARAIGAERDFTRRVEHQGPQDEVGQLATTFNAMLAQLQAAYQRVAQALEMQRSFVADVSHELRTPLTTLRGNLALLRRTPPIPAEEQADILNDSVEESERLIRLVNDLLVLARADAGRSLNKETLNLLPLLEESCRQARQLAPERSLSLQAAPELSVLGDRDALKQVLLIALDNALKHSSGAIEVQAAARGEWVELSVQDHGPGIPADKLPHVFDRFYRGEDSAAPGFGLGLAIAKSLVEAQGGTIALQSEPGRGSRLVVSLAAG